MKARARSLARALPAAALLTALGAPPAAAQSLEVTPDTARVTVGDPITLTITPRLPAGAAPLDRVPAPAGQLPEGFRILGSDSLARAAGGALEARLRVAFFRPGRQSVPPLALAYVPAPGVPADTLQSAPVPIEVVPVLPAGDQTLRDIKDLAAVPRGAPWGPWLAIALALAAMIAAVLLVRRLRRRPAPPAASTPAAAPSDSRTPYERAIERLAALEKARLPERGEVARHYDLATDALRRYLEESGAVPALELTTAELARALPPPLAGGGLGEAGLRLLQEADLVKFARVRPSAEAARRLVPSARDLLGRWNAHLAALAPAMESADGGAVPRGAGAAVGVAATASDGAASERPAGPPPPAGPSTTGASASTAGKGREGSSQVGGSREDRSAAEKSSPSAPPTAV